ncbi:MBL fold metallo-hydrolase [Rhodococcus sp. SBT000017]|uniref:MBL fold metallo-hydrolase n=1 Tax=Rhodococcus sp. SBT000017 TaxID=1803385 RepID=UPI0037C976E9
MSTTDPDIAIIETSSLGDRSYLVSHDGIAVVIDPQRDIDRVLALAAEKNATITHVLETHIHNDYVTGGLELARATGAEYVVPEGDPVEFERRAVGDGDVVDAGSATFQVMHTRPYTSSRQLRTATRRRTDRDLHRRLDALRIHRPHRPTRLRTHRRAHPCPVPLGPSNRRRTPRRRRGLPHPRIR